MFLAVFLVFLSYRECANPCDITTVQALCKFAEKFGLITGVHVFCEKTKWNISANRVILVGLLAGLHKKLQKI